MRILVAVAVEDDDAADVMAAVRRFPWPSETLFRVITVAPVAHPSAPDLVVSGASVSELQRNLVLRAENIAASAAARLRDAGMKADSVSVEGDPKAAIIDQAKQWEADLIVVGSSRRSRLERWVLGSVSRGVVTAAATSVLVVKNIPAHE